MPKVLKKFCSTICRKRYINPICF
ncbi:MAG: hypothetical protein KH543_11740 [Clostridiaceae bacterium]|nr:hypothetical protein [Clostridiaceae bacterium]